MGYYVRLVAFVFGFAITGAGWFIDRPDEFPFVGRLVAPDAAAAAAALDRLEEGDTSRLISPEDPGFSFLIRHWPFPLDPAMPVVAIGRSVSYLEMGDRGSAGGDVGLRAVMALEPQCPNEYKDQWTLSAARRVATHAVRWRLTVWSGAVVFAGLALSLLLGLREFLQPRAEGPGSLR